MILGDAMFGTVNWIDSDGRGSILGDNDVMYRIHDFTVIFGSASAGKRVEFRLDSCSSNPIVKTISVRE
jgi:hypothetical protein